MTELKARIAFVATTHFANDDRIYYHQAMSLAEQGFEVLIIAVRLRNEFYPEYAGVKYVTSSRLKEKSEEIQQYLLQYRPDVIICSEPVSTIISWRYKRKFPSKTSVIYDITEWYPSKKQLKHDNILKKIIKVPVMLSVNYFAGLVSNANIYGEHYKALPFKVFMPWKKYVMLPYYPFSDYFKRNDIHVSTEKFILCYTGELSKDKGFVNFLHVLDSLFKIESPEKYKLKVIGWFPDLKDSMMLDDFCNIHKGLEVQRNDFLSFHGFIHELKDVDLCLDLREHGFENDYALPIKLFNYLAAGKPVIYSDLKAIRQHISMDGLGYLVNPSDYVTIAALIKQYADDKGFHKKHCENTINIINSKYNWRLIDYVFCSFVKRYVK